MEGHVLGYDMNSILQDIQEKMGDFEVEKIKDSESLKTRL